MIWGDSYGWRKNTSCETRVSLRFLNARSTTKLLNPFGRISDSPMLGQMDMSLILSSLFLSLIRHVHRQIHYQNQITNVQRAYHILTYKNWFMLWQTSIMYSGKHDFLDWIISATTILKIQQTKAHFPATSIIPYRVVCPIQQCRRSV